MTPEFWQWATGLTRSYYYLELSDGKFICEKKWQETLINIENIDYEYEYLESLIYQVIDELTESGEFVIEYVFDTKMVLNWHRGDDFFTKDFDWDDYQSKTHARMDMLKVIWERIKK